MAADALECIQSLMLSRAIRRGPSVRHCAESVLSQRVFGVGATQVLECSKTKPLDTDGGAAAMADEPAKVRFTYVASEGYAPVYANGAFGGVTPKNEIVMNFLHERFPLPKADIHPVQKGVMGPPEHPAADTVTIERHVVGGVVMNEQFARELHVWLGQKLEELRVQREMQRSAVSGASH